MRYLIAYDVSDARRLRKTQRWAQQHTLPLQRSVWLFDGGEAAWQQCLCGFLQRIDRNEDSLMVLPVTPTQQITQHGTQQMNRDILIL